MSVLNTDGQPLGKLEGLLIDLNSGQLKYVIVASQGFLGIGRKHRIVPARYVSSATALRNTLMLNVTLQRWQEAPFYKRSQRRTLSDPEQARRINQFYAQAAPATPISHSNVAAKVSVPDRSLSPSGREPTPDRLVLDSELIGSTVLDRQREGAGRILDLLVTFKPNPGYALMSSSGRLFNKNQQIYAVSLRALTPLPDRKFMVQADRSSFPNAPRFGSRSPASTTQPASAVFRFRNADQQGLNLFPGQPIRT